MHYLITGGSGFIGRALCRRLNQLGHRVTVFDLTICSEAASQIVDVRRPLPDEHNPDVIVHLAAVARIGEAAKAPQLAAETNCQGTLNVLEYARTRGRPPKFIFAGSFSCGYDNYKNVYTHSKSQAEEHCRFYHRFYGLPVAIPRFFNVYGPEDERGLIGSFYRHWTEGRPLPVYGNGSNRRDFIHVEDVVSGLIALGYSNHYDTTVFQLGTGVGYSILEVAQMFGGAIEFRAEIGNEPAEVVADLSIPRKYLGFNPQHSLPEYISQKTNLREPKSPEAFISPRHLAATHPSAVHSSTPQR